MPPTEFETVIWIFSKYAWNISYRSFGLRGQDEVDRICGPWSSGPFTPRMIYDTPQWNRTLVPGCISALCSPDMYVIRGGVWGVWEQCDHHQRIMIPAYCMRHRPVVAVMLWDKKPTSWENRRDKLTGQCTRYPQWRACYPKAGGGSTFTVLREISIENWPLRAFEEFFLMKICYHGMDLTVD